MKIQTGKFSLAAAGVVGAIYALCSLFVVLFPAASENLMSALTHTKGSLVRGVTAGGFILGLVQMIVYTLIASWILAALLNKYSTKE